jgi:AraC family transcriptional regulator, regulatory protein of adaptative response / methylated-DNA-[protein]-cysteine methyltransferase
LDNKELPMQTQDRIARAIGYLAANYQDQPSLDAAAKAAGLAPHHFQRMFRRWVGVSPKKFVQFLTLDHAKASLEESQSVLDAALDAGLSGPSRLHDLFLTVEAMTPGEFRRRGEGLKIVWGAADSQFGTAVVLATERGLCGLGFELAEGIEATRADLACGIEAAEYVRDDAAAAEIARRIFGSTRSPVPLRLLLRGTPYQLKVWNALLRIPEGAVVSYEGLAERLGGAEQTRAVARAVATNPVSYVIPCHRVIRKTGAITGYRWGPTRKAALLGWEAARKSGLGATEAA